MSFDPLSSELEKNRDELQNRLQFLENITNAAQESIYVILPDFTLEYVNKHAAEMVGLPVNDMQGKHLEDLYPPSIAARFMEALKSVFEKGEPVHEVSKVELNQQDVWLDTLITPMKNHLGQTEKLLGISRDITERKLVEIEVSDSELKYRTLIENANDGIYIRDKDGIIEFVNNKFEEIHGYTREELIGTKSWEYLHPDDLPGTKQNGIHADILGKGFQGRSRIITKSGEVRYVDINTVPINLKNQEKAFGIVRDITPRVKMEERLKMLTKISNEGIIIHEYGQVVDVNPRLLEMIQIDYETAMQKQLFDFVKPSYHQLIRQKFAEDFTGSYEIIAMRADHSEFPAEVKVKTVKYKEETLRVVSITDISVRKSVEKELRQLSTAVKQSPVSIVITDLHGTIEYINPQYTKITGYRPEEVIGKNTSILKTGKTPKSEYKKLWETILSGDVWEGEFLNKRKDGSTYWELATISPINNAKGEIINFLAIKEDITERKITEAKLRTSEKKLKESNATKDKFFSILAHDLRGPIGNLMNLLTILTEEEQQLTPQEVTYFLRQSQELTESTYDLLENLLNWSKIQLNKVDLVKERVNLFDLVEATYKLYKENIHQKNIHFVNHLQPKTILNTNKETVKVVLRNLISNAIKFTPEGGNIEVYASQKSGVKGLWKVCVKDTGVGIAPEVVPRLFKIDENVQTEGTGKEKGNGLGLILCREFAERNGGNIYVESEPGAGSIFCFTLPQA